MQFPGPLDDHAAKIIVAGDLFALVLARYDVGARLRSRVKKRKSLRLPLEMLSCPRADKAARLFPEAIDAFFGDQAIDQRKGVRRIGQHRLGPIPLDLEGLPCEALADIHAAADGTAITGTRPEAEFVRLEHNSVDATSRQFQRRR